MLRSRSKCSIRNVRLGKSVRVIARSQNQLGFSGWSTPIRYVPNSKNTWRSEVSNISSSPSTSSPPELNIQTPTTTTLPTRPLGEWKVRWMGLVGDSPKDSSGSNLGGPGVNVIYGQPTEVVICQSSGDLPAKLEVKDGGVWRTVASGFRTENDTYRCASTERPVAFSFYWVVDVFGLRKFRANGQAYYTRDLEIKMTTSSNTSVFLRYVGDIEASILMDVAINIRCSFSGTC